ncbi:MAG: hypothetical protein AAGA56_15545 [Myxococcota bacterium]
MTAAATTPESTSTLPALLRSGASRDEIRSHLERLSDERRVAEATALRGGQVKKLYEAVGGGPPLSLDDFAPEGSRQAFVFEGRNSLPTFSSFQKRFARVSSGQVVGYNHQAMAFVTGPGFFVVRPADATADVPDELYFDYTAVPDGFPEGFPAYKPNDAGLSNLVYKGMKDYMRSVADKVVVGHAFKGGKPQSAYFVLARR